MTKIVRQLSFLQSSSSSPHSFLPAIISIFFFSSLPHLLLNSHPRYNAELLYWATCLTPYLLKASSSRKIQPQPKEVKEDTESHAVAAQANQREDADLYKLATDFVKLRVTEWKRESKEPPKDRNEINAAFCEYVKGLNMGIDVPNPQEALVNSGILANHEGTTRFKLNFEGRTYATYKMSGRWATLKPPRSPQARTVPGLSAIPP